MITTPEQMREAAARDKDLIRRGDAFEAAELCTCGDCFTDTHRAIRAIPIAPQPTPVVDGSGPGPHYVADMLSQFVASVWHLLDNSETSGPIDDPITTVMQSDFDEVSKWLDRLEALPSGSTSHLSAAELVATYLAPQPVALTAKPLVWDAIEQDRGDGSSDLTGDWTSETPFSAYSIVVGFGTDSYTFDVYYGEMGFVSSHDDPDTAKAAAQADYEARILSALTIQPADPLSDPRVKALVEALALAQYGLSWASAYFRDSNPPYCDDPCPPVNRGLDATRAALRAIGGEA